MWPFSKQIAPDAPAPRTWTLRKSHGLIERSTILAEMAFSDFANDRFGMTERAAFRIAEALETYAKLDATTGISDHQSGAAEQQEVIVP